MLEMWVEFLPENDSSNGEFNFAGNKNPEIQTHQFLSGKHQTYKL